MRSRTMSTREKHPKAPSVQIQGTRARLLYGKGLAEWQAFVNNNFVKIPHERPLSRKACV